MDAAFVLYEGMTALDLIGPYDVLAHHPSVTPHFLARQRGPIRCDAGLILQATAAFDELPRPDLIVVPGGTYWRKAQGDKALISWLAAAHPTAAWTTSVCTGSCLLATAGILTGRRATTHWAARKVLTEHGAVVSTERVVVDGDVITGAGVSAGIDMALTLAGILWGEKVAQFIQLGIEYDPQPPFAAGSPETAPAWLVAGMRQAGTTRFPQFYEALMPVGMNLMSLAQGLSQRLGRPGRGEQADQPAPGQETGSP